MRPLLRITPLVVHERYVLKVRHSEQQLAAVAPLLCAGITTYSPLRHWQVGDADVVAAFKDCQGCHLNSPIATQA